MALRALLVLSAVAAALSARLPEPGELALVLSEEQFEDYLDAWLALEEPKWTNRTGIATRSGACSADVPRTSGCELRVNGDLGEPQPVFLRDGEFVVPTSNTGLVHLDAGEELLIACTGSGRVITHPNIAATLSYATAKCVADNIISGEGWLSAPGEFLPLTCSSNPQYVALGSGDTCYGGATVIEAGFDVDGVFKPSFRSCFNQNSLEVHYTWYEQNPQNAVHQSSVSRPGWLVSTWFPGVGINSRYTQVEQKAKIASYVGEELADKYVTTQQYLARGHLCAKTDQIFASTQRSTFFFVNAAPQWQPFNGGNWNWLEQNLRARIGAAGYYTTVYTGTFGVTQLRNESGQLVDIYLYKDANNNDQLPVPLYFYKVVYEPTLLLGTAFVSINNPYYTEEEVRALTFCTDVCRNNAAFSWLNWQPDRIEIGYSFCCTVDDFRRTVPHLPEFQVDGILA